MSISTTTTNPSVEDVEKFDTNQLITFLQGKKNLYLIEDDFAILRKEKVSGHTFLCLNMQKLVSPPYNLRAEPAKRIERVVKDLNSKSRF